MTALVLGKLGSLASEEGDCELARSLFEQSLAIRRELGDRRGVASALNMLGISALRQSDYEVARRLLDESLAVARETRDHFVINRVLKTLADLAEYERDDVRADQPKPREKAEFDVNN